MVVVADPEDSYQLSMVNVHHCVFNVPLKSRKAPLPFTSFFRFHCQWWTRQLSASIKDEKVTCTIDGNRITTFKTCVRYISWLERRTKNDFLLAPCLLGTNCYADFCFLHLNWCTNLQICFFNILFLSFL